MSIATPQLYIGHPKNSSNPKTRDYWMGIYQWVVVFDPTIVHAQLQEAREQIKHAQSSGHSILVLCEKDLYREEIEQLSLNHGFYYLNNSIPSWVLTNFDTLLSRVKSLEELRSFIGSSSFVSLTKKEQSVKKRQLAKIERVYKWVVGLKKKPDLVVVVDGQFMQKFLHEIQKIRSNAIVLASSNFDQWFSKYLVMCNVNSYQSIDYVLKYLFS
jgi:small subunit ribosomal protein S2